MVSSTKLKWKTDLDKQVIIQNFEKRGWIKANGEGGTVFTHIVISCSYSRGLEHLLGQRLDCQADLQP